MHSQRRPTSRQHWTSALSRDLHNFVIQLLPTAEEMAIKEDVRKLLERLIRTIEPDSRLLSFGSTANGFSLRNSGECTASLSVESVIEDGWMLLQDMDLCCLIDSDRPPLNASDLVTMVGDLLERGVHDCPSCMIFINRVPRNQVSSQDLAARPNTYRQALLGRIAWSAVWHLL